MFKDAIEAEKKHLAKSSRAAKLRFAIYCFYNEFICESKKNSRLTSSFGLTRQNLKLIWCNWTGNCARSARFISY